MLIYLFIYLKILSFCLLLNQIYLFVERESLLKSGNVKKKLVFIRIDKSEFEVNIFMLSQSLVVTIDLIGIILYLAQSARY